MRIGILGGTFNPIHMAHLRCAEEVREAQQLDRILFVPSATPPHKQAAGLASMAHRLAMVRLAIAGNPYFRVSTIEMDRLGHSFSVDTVRALRAHLPRARFAFIVGMDAFIEIGTWKDYRTLFGLCDLIVMSRPSVHAPRLRSALPVAARADFCYRQTTTTLEHSTGHHIVYQQISDLDISASAVRERLARGGSIRYLVPIPVERYIARRHLYARRVASR